MNLSAYQTDTMQCLHEGDLVSTQIDRCKQKLDATIRTGLQGSSSWTVLELNLCSARFVDSKGIGFLITLIRELKMHDRKLRIVISSKSVHYVLHFMRIDSHAEVVLTDFNNSAAA